MSTTTRNLGDPPLVTALICNYNYGSYLAEAIDSALAQTWENIEIIVVDDGSTDDSREILQQYGDRIRVLLKDNGGQASAFNIGIAAARGEIICFLDTDDTWSSDKVAQVIRKFQAGDWGLVCHELQAVCSDGVPLPREDARYCEDTHLEEAVPLHELRRRGYPWIFAPTSAMSLRTDVARRLLPIPESTWRICADNPIAYGGTFLAPTGVVRMQLGKYRQHESNGFSNQRQGGARYSVKLVELQSKRHIYVSKLQGAEGSRDQTEPAIPYTLFRSICFMASHRPVRHLAHIIKRCFEHHMQSDERTLQRIVHATYRTGIDATRTVLITLNLRPRYKSIREEYRRIRNELDPEVQELISDALAL